jgi:hypothetical protein
MYRGALFTSGPAPLAGAEQTLDERIIVRTKLIVATAALLLFTTACGSDESSDSASDATTAEAGGEEGASRDETNATIVSGWVSIGQQSNSTFDEACLADLAAQLSDEDAAKVAAEPDIPGEQLSEEGSAVLAKVILDCVTSL